MNADHPFFPFYRKFFHFSNEENHNIGGIKLDFSFEIVQGHLDAEGGVFLPVHWGAFDLSVHSWDEPIIRAFKAAKENGVRISTQKLGCWWIWRSQFQTNHGNVPFYGTKFYFFFTHQVDSDILLFSTSKALSLITFQKKLAIRFPREMDRTRTGSGGSQPLIA